MLRRRQAIWHTVLHWKLRRLSRAFKSFEALLVRRERREALFDRTLARWRHRDTAKAYASWSASHMRARQLRSTVARMFLRREIRQASVAVKIWGQVVIRSRVRAIRDGTGRSQAAAMIAAQVSGRLMPAVRELRAKEIKLREDLDELQVDVHFSYHHISLVIATV